MGFAAEAPTEPVAADDQGLFVYLRIPKMTGFHCTGLPPQRVAI